MKKGKTVTRKGLHPLNDCRHWVDRAGPYSGDPDVISHRRERDLAQTRTSFQPRHSTWILLGTWGLISFSSISSCCGKCIFLPFRSWGKYCLHYIDTFVVRVGIPTFETGTENPVVIRIRRETTCLFQGKPSSRVDEEIMEVLGLQLQKLLVRLSDKGFNLKWNNNEIISWYSAEGAKIKSKSKYKKIPAAIVYLLRRNDLATITENEKTITNIKEIERVRSDELQKLRKQVEVFAYEQ